MRTGPVVLTLVSLAGFTSALDCTLSDSQDMTSNPIGSCACDGQLWIGPGCHEGYWCESTSGAGCYKSCPDGEFLATDFINDSWECVTEAATPLAADRHFDFFDESKTTTTCPSLDGYHVCPSDGDIPTPIPPAEVTENPLGTCRCNGEIWLAEGCAYGFYCDDTEDIGGVYLYCPEGENLHVNFDTDDWFCDSTPGNCPGGEILGTGCAVPICQYSINPYGDCKCENQLFISNDCTQGFRCYDGLPDPYLFDGCVMRCLNGQIVVPDFETKSLRCIDAPDDFKCPGSLQMFCPEDDIGTDFQAEDCECDGQLRVSADCSESFYCLDRLPSGGAGIKCNDGEIIDLDFLDYSWSCSANTGNCPSAMGGFELGCPDDGENPIPPPPDCTFGKNEIVEDGCECNGQMFVSDDCTQMFYCSNYIPADQPDADGCLLDCPAADGLRASIDLINKEWECVDREVDYICPGQLQTDCTANFDILCECKNQIWINDDCSQGYWCSDEYDVDNTENPGSFIRCPPGTIVSMTFIYPPRYQCVPDQGQCPGSFHFGCNGGDLIDLTTPAPTTTYIPIDTTEPAEVTTDDTVVTTDYTVVPTDEPVTVVTTDDTVVTTDDTVVTTTEPQPVVTGTTDDGTTTREVPVTTTEEPVDPVITTTVYTPPNSASSLYVPVLLVSAVSFLAKLIN